MLDLEQIEATYAVRGGWKPYHVTQLIAEVRELRQKLAELASGDPAVRAVLLREFGTTDPELLQETAQDRHQQIRELRARDGKLQAAVEAAYDHIDTYGYPNHPDERLMASQKNVFDLLRPFVKRPKPGCL